MKRGETLHLSDERKRLLHLPEDASQEEQRTALDVQCHHETDPGVNMYLFLKQREPGIGFQFMCANPDGVRKREGPHVCWWPKARALELKVAFLAGGHHDSFEAEAFKWRGYGKEFRTFLHHYFKAVEEKLEEEKKRQHQQMKLRLVR